MVQLPQNFYTEQDLKNLNQKWFLTYNKHKHFFLTESSYDHVIVCLAHKSNVAFKCVAVNVLKYTITLFA
jgi:hypothetical protein